MVVNSSGKSVVAWLLSNRQSAGSLITRWMRPRTDSVRIFLTVYLVYAAFMNPWLQSSMTWNFLDAAVSFTDTGRWEMAHPQLYERMDTASTHGRLVSGEPPGMAVLVMPFYLGWRSLVGPVETKESFQAFNAVLVLMVSAPAAALVAVQVAWLAGWVGAGRRGRLLAALLVAFGTQDFFFGTTLFKEGPAALGAVSAFRLAVESGGAWRRVGAGFVVSAATAVSHPVGLLGILLLLLINVREGSSRAMAFFAGCAPIAFALGSYNVWLFGSPWHTGYMFLEGVAHPGFVQPTLAVLLDELVMPRSGLFLYAPFLVAGCIALSRSWGTDRRGEMVVTLVFLVGLWLAAASWQSQFSERANGAASLGPRRMFPAIPFLGAFAGLYLEHVKRGMLLLLAVPSVVCGYLSAQAGLIPGADLFPYAVKTWISGTGMGVLFKEALPLWLGFDTLHTVVSRPEVSASDLLRLLPTTEGTRLIGNQLLLLGVNLLVLGGIVWFLLRLWKTEEKRIEQ